jgi:hypothetical protein
MRENAGAERDTNIFFTNQASTATTPSGTKFKLTFTPDGKMTREPLAQRGNKSTGTRRVSQLR